MIHVWNIYLQVDIPYMEPLGIIYSSISSQFQYDAFIALGKLL